ncbi:MAG: M28 family peptidase [Planctomycetes bacterium]|nr:M28 family peptidase [Planctomycetota bacterium]
MFVISCHADTGFKSHRLRRLPGGVVEGNLDNFAGCYAVMQAYFSGRMDFDHVRIELTWGEEAGLLGAKELVGSLDPKDLVTVVDVTGAPTENDFTIEKCPDPKVQAFLDKTLKGMKYDLFEGCPDPIASCDESDVYVEKCPHTFFLGIPCTGGDYNVGVVRCRQASLDAVAEALCRIAANSGEF